jgi:hypothetical protein
MALFVKAKKPPLAVFSSWKTHDTCHRLFRNLDPEQFRASFQRFITQFPGTARRGGP